jgi:hypothetical protein
MFETVTAGSHFRRCRQSNEHYEQYHTGDDKKTTGVFYHNHQ